MVRALQTYRVGFSDVVDNLDGGNCVGDAEALAAEDILVAAGVQVGEAIAEFDFLTVDGHGAVGPGTVFFGGFREGVAVDTEEPFYPCPIKLKVSTGPIVGVDVHGIFSHIAEEPGQHVVKMHADIGGYAAGFTEVAFPACVVPFAAGGDVREFDVIFFTDGAGINFFPKGQ